MHIFVHRPHVTTLRNGVAVVLSGADEPSRRSGDSNHAQHAEDGIAYTSQDLESEMRSLQPRQLTGLIVGVAIIMLHPFLALGEDSTAKSFLDEGHPTPHERSTDPDRQHPAGDNHHERPTTQTGLTLFATALPPAAMVTQVLHLFHFTVALRC